MHYLIISLLCFFLGTIIGLLISANSHTTYSNDASQEIDYTKSKLEATIISKDDEIKRLHEALLNEQIKNGRLLEKLHNKSQIPQ